ncbi:SRPBCC domain-containing protein [Rothia halotolerans]|uniref:SRPBCC domain-containing protein n=1 Tax=Rothia halotolerans TaxID=405770 RepID=UPI001EE03AD8|nr:SRPBCC domain-containing protein [Rothia halotolerans]
MNTSENTGRQGEQGLVIEIEREFAASRERVFRRWTDAEALARWFAPPGYVTLRSAADPRPGGAWRLDFRSDSGEHEYSEQGLYREVEPWDRLVLTLTQVDGAAANPLTVVTVLLEEVGDAEAPRTRMRFTQSGYDSRRLREDNEQGWRGCLTALARDLEASEESAEPGGPAASGESEPSGDEAGRPDPAEAERELRELFEAWFEASERKDVDAQMEPIAEGIVSYEHEAPQERRGIDAVRAVCAAGMEYQTGEFRWDIPDLQIRVIGDTAVTWGLNRMRNVAPDGTVREDWSRGTRVFERRGGRWRMIHQHVSFPVDAEGRAVTER